MKKKILVMILILLVIILVGYLVFYFVNVPSSKANNDNIIIENDVTYILEKKLIYYSDVDFVAYNDIVLSINVNSNKIKICENNFQQCFEQDYVIDKSKIKIEKYQNYELYGIFSVSYENEILLLEKEIKEDDSIVVYYFKKLDNN